MEKERIKRKFENPVIISALRKEGLEEIVDRIVNYLQKDMENIEITLPHKHYALLKMIRENGTIKEEEYRENGVFISARVPKKIKYSLFKKLKTKTP